MDGQLLRADIRQKKYQLLDSHETLLPCCPPPKPGHWSGVPSSWTDGREQAVRPPWAKDSTTAMSVPEVWPLFVASLGG